MLSLEQSPLFVHSAISRTTASIILVKVFSKFIQNLLVFLRQNLINLHFSKIFKLKNKIFLDFKIFFNFCELLNNIQVLFKFFKF